MQHARLIRAVKLGIKNLLLHKLRSLLTVLGLVFGVGSVIAMLSVGEGASQQALREIKKLVVEECPKPVCPNDGLLLKVQACAVCATVRSVTTCWKCASAPATVAS